MEVLQEYGRGFPDDVSVGVSLVRHPMFGLIVAMSVMRLGEYVLDKQKGVSERNAMEVFSEWKADLACMKDDAVLEDFMNYGCTRVDV